MRNILGVVSCLLVACAVSPLAADPVEDFYKDRQVTVIFTGAVGSIYDISARLVTKHMADHIPGKPVMVVKAMPGGGHVVGTNWLYNVAPRDGSALASIGEAIPLTQVLEPEKVKFDVAKFIWLGNPNVANLVLTTWSATGIKTIEDAKAREVVIGAGGATSPSGQIPKALNNIVGTKFKVITGFTSTHIDLAMERGEVDGRGSALWAWWKTGRASWVEEKKLNHLVQWGPKRDRELPDVPLLTEFAKNEAERQVFQLLSSTVIVGRPILTTPEVPADRVTALKESFVKAMDDKNYRAEAARAKLDVNPMFADEMQKLIEAIIATPPEVVTLTKAATTQGQSFDCKALVKDPALCEGTGSE
jgi:tripartite-type tricarboxylate transporter receptor subunit TctC